jgi:SAM-dependent methyltransferase
MSEDIDPIPAATMGRSETALHRIAPISSPGATNHGRYIFDNAAAETAARFSALATIFDPGTIRHLTEIGVTKGWTCLEIGAGGGTIADWLCDRVGPEGRVTATDIDTQYLNSLNKPNLDVRRHDIARDVLPQEAFDLVHVRLVLVHLPERNEVLTRIVSALKPGGWLLAEEFDSLSLQPDPVIASTEIPIKTLSAMEQLMALRGVDSLYGRRLAARVRSLGLASVTAEGRLFMWEGQSTGADLTRANFKQIRNELIELGLITESEFDRDVDLLAQYELLFPSPIMWAVRGRRPA